VCVARILQSSTRRPALKAPAVCVGREDDTGGSPRVRLREIRQPLSQAGRELLMPGVRLQAGSAVQMPMRSRFSLQQGHRTRSLAKQVASDDHSAAHVEDLSGHVGRFARSEIRRPQRSPRDTHNAERIKIHAPAIAMTEAVPMKPRCEAATLTHPGIPAVTARTGVRGGAAGAKRGSNMIIDTHVHVSFG